LNFILRAFYGNWDTDASVAATLAFLREAHFRGIMFWDGYGHWEPNHHDEKTLTRRARRLAQVVPRFRRAGFSTGLNIHTIGFTYSPPDARELGFQYQMAADGTQNRQIACPLCPRFREYLDFLAGTFAVEGLDYVMVDDDFNYMVGEACYCPLHMAAFSKAIGEKMTRDRWLQIARSPDFQPGTLSQTWARAQNEALLSAAQVIEQALHRGQPGIRLGFMGINAGVCDFGLDFTKRLLEICRGPNGLAPLVRPSVSAYWDWQRWPAHGACSHFTEMYLRTVLPADVTPLLELDCGAPWTTYDHGTEHLRHVIERNVATGSRDFAFLLFPDSPRTAIPKAHPYTLMLRKHHRKFEGITDLVGENVIFEGVDSRPAAGRNLVDPLNHRFYGIPSFSLARIGLPMAPTGEWVPILHGVQPWLIGKEKLPAYAEKGVIIDAKALHAMARMGCRELIADARIEEWSNPPVGLEMTGHPLNGDAAGQFFSNLGSFRKDCRRLRGEFDERDVLSWWVDSTTLRRIGPAEVAAERYGRRLLLLAYDLDQQTPERQLLVANPIRQQMFHNVCEWIARRPLPALLRDGVDVQLFCMRSPDGKRRVITLTNAGFNRFEELTIDIAALPRENARIRTVTESGLIRAIAPAGLKRLKDRWRFKLKEELVPGPMEVRVFAFE